MFSSARQAGQFAGIRWMLVWAQGHARFPNIRPLGLYSNWLRLALTTLTIEVYGREEVGAVFDRNAPVGRNGALPGTGRTPPESGNAKAGADQPGDGKRPRHQAAQF